jgi:hypothetical protein
MSNEKNNEVLVVTQENSHFVMSSTIKGVLALLLLFFAFLALMLLLRLIGSWRISNHHINSRAHEILQGKGSLNEIASYNIPKVIWSYWHSETLPPFIAFNIARWRDKLGSEYEIRLLNETNLHQYVEKTAIPQNLNDYSKQHQADWLRLYLLHHYGGLWCDNGILFNSLDALNDIHLRACANKVDIAGFYIKLLETDHRFPVFENWMILAPDPATTSLSQQNPSFISAWYFEFNKAIAMGFEAYDKYAVEELGVNPQKILSSMFLNSSYLTQHLCFQTVLQKQQPDAKLYLLRAEDSMFVLQDLMQWNPFNMAYSLSLEKAQELPFIKLRGGDRNGFPLEKWQSKS